MNKEALLSQEKTDSTAAAIETPQPAKRSTKGLWRAVLGIVIVIAISITVFVVSDRIEQFSYYGYPGIFVISLLSSATIILPAPSLAVVSVMGSVLNPFLVGLCAGVGESLGELTGYFAGYSGRAVVENREQYERMYRWTQKYGLWVILALSMIPSPFFDLAGIAAGALKIQIHKFLLTSFVGKTIKATLFALGGQAVFMQLLHR